MTAAETRRDQSTGALNSFDGFADDAWHMCSPALRFGSPRSMQALLQRVRLRDSPDQQGDPPGWFHQLRRALLSANILSEPP